MSGIVKYSQIATAATSSEVDANSQLAITVDMLGTPTTKYLTGEVLKEVIRDEFGDFFLVAGTGITVVHDDALNTFTISVTPNTYQPLDAGLTSIAGLTTAADKMIYTTASDTYAVTDLSAFARTILDDADALTARATLGLVIGTDVQAYSANLDALAADPLTATTAASTYQPLDADLTAIAALSSADGNFIVGSATGWVAESGATARTSLGLGTGDSVQFTNGTFTGTLAGGNTTISGFLDVVDTSTNRDGLTITKTSALGFSALDVYHASSSNLRSVVKMRSVAGTVFNMLADGALSVLGPVTVASDLTLASGSITSASGAISFGDENLSTTGLLTVTSNIIAGSDSTPPIATNANEFVAHNNTRQIGMGVSGSAAYMGTRSAHDLIIYAHNATQASVSASAWDFQDNNITTTGTLASGNATVTGTLKTSSSAVIGSTSVTADGTLHVHTGSAGSVAASSAANDLTVESSTTGGISVLVPDASNANIILGSPSDSVGALIQWNYNASAMSVGTNKAGASTEIRSGNGVAALTLDSSQNATFVGAIQNTSTGTSYFSQPTALVLGTTATSSNAQFYATKTYSAASGTNRPAYFSYTQSVATTGEHYNISTQAAATHTSGTVAGMYGLLSDVVVSGAGGTTSNAIGLYAGIRNTNASAVITNAYGLFIATYTATGTISNRWAIYSAETGASYLAGSLRIGTTSATSHAGEVLRVEGAQNRVVNIHHSTSSSGYIQFTNTTTGTASGDGFLIGIDGSENATLFNQEATAMAFYTSSTERFRVAADKATIFVNETENANMTVGLTINQGANDDEILAFKSSDVAHGYTSVGETDTYGYLRKVNNGQGGVRVVSIAEDAAVDTSFQVTAYGATASATKSTSGVGLIDLYVAEHDGANAVANVTADGNIMSVRARVGGSDLARWILDEDGDTWQTGSLTTGAPSGGTAAPWKLGTVSATSPTSPNRTIEVDINGTTYYIHAKTTND